METAEELQVVNYGIGGHYEPHFDFARVSWRSCKKLSVIDFNLYLFQKDEKNSFKNLGTGNRIATVLFYVSFS